MSDQREHVRTHVCVCMIDPQQNQQRCQSAVCARVSVSRDRARQYTTLSYGVRAPVNMPGSQLLITAMGPADLPCEMIIARPIHGTDTLEASPCQSGHRDQPSSARLTATCAKGNHPPLRLVCKVCVSMCVRDRERGSVYVCVCSTSQVMMRLSTTRDARAVTFRFLVSGVPLQTKHW